MKVWSIIFTMLIFASTALAAGQVVDYKVNGADYEGYYTSPSAKAPLVILLHDWDGLTDYEVKRAEMLAELGYAVFAADLFGKGARPTELVDKKQHTGELYKDRAKMRALIQGAVDEAKKKVATQVMRLSWAIVLVARQSLNMPVPVLMLKVSLLSTAG